MVAKKTVLDNKYLFGDFETKAPHVLEWVKRRAKEGFDGDTRSVVGQEPLTLELIGDRQHLLKALYGTVDIKESDHDEDREDKVRSLIDSLNVERIPGGATNIAVRVRGDASDTPGLFVKIGLPYAQWAKKKKCPVSRIDREFLGLNILNDICPGVASWPVLCGSDELHQDGTRYLVVEFLPLHFERLVLRYQKRVVADSRPEIALGYVLAKVHVESPSRFNGRDGVYDAETKRFIANVHYKRTAETTNAYMNIDDFSSPEVQKHFILPVDPTIGQKHATYLRQRPEVVRAIARHWENYHDPPDETATFIHGDAHGVNILVSTKDVSYPYSVDGEAYDPGEEGLIKIVDMEFSNWGPAGADLGMSFASAVFYSFVHSFDIEAVVKSDAIIESISECWRSYRKSYVKCSRLMNRTDGSIALSLYHIVHEAIGWVGFWIFRFTSPTTFPTVCCAEFLYPLPQGLEEHLSSRSLSGEDGMELLRYAVNTFAAESLIVGFGDEIMERLAGDDIVSIDIGASNRVIETFLQNLTAKRNELHTSLERASHHPSEGCPCSKGAPKICR